MAHGCHPKCYHSSNMRGLEPKELDISSDTLDKSLLFIISHKKLLTLHRKSVAHVISQTFYCSQE